MTKRKANTIALAGTLAFHLILVFVLLSFGFNIVPAKEEVGTEVNLGNVDEASGMFEPAGTEIAASDVKPKVEAQQSDDQDIMSQDMEESIPVTKKKTDKKASAEHPDKAKNAEQKAKDDQEREAAEIRKQTAAVFGKSSKLRASQGTASTGKGNQGSREGSIYSSAASGKGKGYGGFSLAGRNIKGSLPRPSYSIQEDGVVVVRIIVNPEGHVTSASISLHGTTTDNSTLRQAALNAARQARFNAIEGSQSQNGTITYRFMLK